jgi:hypothetical protein
MAKIDQEEKARVRLLKAEDRLIESLYGKWCAGKQISVMRIPRLFEDARAQLRAEVPLDEIGAWMVQFVDAEKL